MLPRVVFQKQTIGLFGGSLLEGKYFNSFNLIFEVYKSLLHPDQSIHRLGLAGYTGEELEAWRYKLAAAFEEAAITREGEGRPASAQPLLVCWKPGLPRPGATSFRPQK